MFDSNTYKALYLETLSRLGLQREVVRAVSGGACLLHGVRATTGDLDLDLPRDVFDAVVCQHGLTVQHLSNGGVLANVMDSVDIHPIDGTLEGVIVDEVFTSTLQHTLEFKLWLNRPKDQDDIIKLKEMVAALEKQ